MVKPETRSTVHLSLSKN